MDSLEEMIASWDAKKVADELDSEVAALSTSNQDRPVTKARVFLLKRAAELLRGKR